MSEVESHILMLDNIRKEVEDRCNDEFYPKPKPFETILGVVKLPKEY